MIDLTQWNITVPIPSPTDETKPLTLSPSALSTYTSEYFCVDDNGHLHFYTSDVGPTTSNSSYPRSELRGCYPDGRARNWTMSETPYKSLIATLAINELPITNKIIVGQIHTKNSTGPLCKIVYDNGMLQARIRTEFEGRDYYYVLGENVQIGELFTYTITIYSNGVLNIAMNRPDIFNLGKSVSVYLHESWYDKLLYFKAGVYSMSNQGGLESCARVVFSNLDVDYCNQPARVAMSTP